MRSLNGKTYAGHWYSSYADTVSGQAYERKKVIFDAEGQTNIMFSEVGVGINETAEYWRLNVGYIEQLLKFNPSYIVFWFAGGGNNDSLAYFDSDGNPHVWFDELLKSGVLN